MIRVTACMLCGCSESTPVQSGVRHDPTLEVRQCRDCGLVFVSPRPTTDELERYYQRLYRDDYREPPVEERHRLDREEAKARVHRLGPLLGPRPRVLEVGSGSGAFLDAIRPHTDQVVGVEPDESSRAYISNRLGLRVRTDVSEVMYEGDTFDLIVLFHVVEHLLQPVEFLHGLRALLRTQGTLIIEVPNVEDVLVSVYAVPAYLRFYYQKAHLYYFSKATLARTLTKAGFHADIQFVQRYDLSNHIRWMLTGKPGGQGYYRKWLLPSVQAAYARSLEHAGLSDTLWAVARPGPSAAEP